MSRLVFMVEELSMRRFLEGLLPRLFPDLPTLIITHDGKQDLEKRLPQRLAHWQVPGDFFVVVRDQDSDDCRVVKDRLVGICRKAGKPLALVRIACNCLESWYLGNLEAVGQAYGEPSLATLQVRELYRNPDRVANAPQEMERIVPDFRKVQGAVLLGRTMPESPNCSRSYQVFLDGIRKILALPEWSHP